MSDELFSQFINRLYDRYEMLLERVTPLEDSKLDYFWARINELEINLEIEPRTSFEDYKAAIQKRREEFPSE